MDQITLSFPDGNQKKFDKGVTSEEIAISIAPSLAKKAISSTVNGQNFYLSCPI
jgi:threonyl-tRNA synthetase